MTNEPLLKVRRLKKYFPIVSGVFRRQVGNVKAVDDIDFDIFPGEVLGMVGESGCGKSTAARASIRLIEPTDGDIHFENQDLRSMNASDLKTVRRHIQIVFQDPFASLNPRKTVLESIGEALIYHGLVRSKQEQVDRVVEILQQVGLSPHAINRYPHQFSGGQQQRICIGRAIAMNPKLVVFDEAVSALDVSVQAQILNLLNELKGKFNLSYLFISHDLAIVRYICDRIAVLYRGKIVESSETEALFQNPQHDYTKTLLSAIPKNHPREKERKH